MQKSQWLFEFSLRGHKGHMLQFKGLFLNILHVQFGQSTFFLTYQINAANPIYSLKLLSRSKSIVNY